MNSYDDAFLNALELEDSLPSTTVAQREANQFRREFYLRLKNRKPNEPTVTNTILDTMYANRMGIDAAPNYRFCPSSDWLKD